MRTQESRRQRILGQQQARSAWNVMTNSIGAGIAIGVAIGAGIGAAIGNVGIGIGVGIAIGAALGAGVGIASQGQDTDGEQNEKDGL